MLRTTHKTILLFLLSLGLVANAQEVIPTQIITGTISGFNKVCLRIPYTYMITESDPGAEYVWEVTGGTFVGSNLGKEVEIVFTEPEAMVSVVKEIVKNGKKTISEPLKFPVNRLAFNVEIINDSGQTAFYTSSTATFSLDLGDIEPDLISWSIKSSGGHRNFGNILNGIHDKTVTVSFNEIGGSPTGILRAEIAKCGVGTAVTFVINLQPKPILEQFTNHQDCKKEPELNTNFSLSKYVYNSEETVTLTIPDYNPDNLYKWYFNGTSYIADSPNTRVQFTESGNYNIRLGITTPQGCSYMTPNGQSQVVSVNKTIFEQGTILPDPANFCENSIVPLTFIAPVFAGNVKDIFWMRGNEEVGRGREYVPTKSGYYWVILADTNGGKCYNMVYAPRIVTICKP